MTVSQLSVERQTSDGQHESVSKGEALKDTVLQTGLEMLIEDGPRVTLGSINYATVFAYLESEYSVRVTRGSVHERIWASQDDFRQEVLTESIAYLTNGQSSREPAIQSRVVNSETFARYAIPAYFRNALDSPQRGRLMAAKALTGRLDEPSEIAAARNAFNKRAHDTRPEDRARSLWLLPRLGLIPKPELGLTELQSVDLIHATAAILFDGGYLNSRTGSIDIEAPLDFRSVPIGDEDPWRIVSIGVKSVLDLLFEETDQPLDSHPSPTIWEPEPPIVKSAGMKQADAGRRSRRELKRIVLTAAVELLLRDGIDLEPEILGYKSVFTRLKETKGITVHRATFHPEVWASNEAFHLEVLAKAIGFPSPETNIFSKVDDGLEALGEPRGIDAGFDAVGDLVDALCEFAAESSALDRVQQIKATFLSDTGPQANAALRAGVADFDREKIDRFKEHMSDAVLANGFEVKPELGLTDQEALELLGVLVGVTISGTFWNQLAGLEWVSQRYPMIAPVSGAKSEWTPAAVAMWAYVRQLYQPSSVG